MAEVCCPSGPQSGDMGRQVELQVDVDVSSQGGVIGAETQVPGMPMWMEKASGKVVGGDSVASGKGVGRAGEGAELGLEQTQFWPYGGRWTRGWHLQVASLAEVGLGAGR